MPISRIKLTAFGSLENLQSKYHQLKSLKKRYFRVIVFVLGLVFTIATATQSLSFSPRSTEILWDTYGIPHIYGKDAQDALHAFGWAQMQSHGNLLLRLYGQARGRGAEYWGEKYLDSDRWVLTMEVPKRARSWYKTQSPTFRRYLDAFAAGVNTYAQTHPDLIDDEVERVLPVTGEDILAHVQRVINFTFIVDPEQIASLSDVNNHKNPKGSNGWAIAPSRSASRKAMLLANPHLPWSDLFLWYEAQLTAPGIDAYGATLVGIPVLAIAFNNNLGWTHTVNTYDGWDAYELKLAEGGYLFDGKVRSFEKETLSLKVKQKNGKLVEQSLEVKHSVHGPILEQKNGKTIALRVAGLDRPGVLEQWWDMARAKNFDRFQAVLQRLQLPMFTVMYADREGHIMHLFNGQVPVRDRGNFEYWEGIIPGDTSKTLWTKTHPYRDLPKVIDPQSGWLQNTNDPPWTTTIPLALDPNNYPAYIAPRDYMNFRSQRSARMLDGDKSISFEEIINYKYSTRMELADRILNDLIPAARRDGNELTRQAADVLENWDRHANPDSRGAVLFAAWYRELDEDIGNDSAFSIPWNENYPLATPDGLANPQKAVAALKIAAEKVQKGYGKLDIPWGNVFRLNYGKVDLPANGGGGELGIFRVVDFAPSEDGSFKSVGGDSYITAVEFSNPVKAMSLNSYGNSTQPNSPHIGDGLELSTQKKLHPVWRSRQEVMSHLEQRKVFANF